MNEMCNYDTLCIECTLILKNGRFFCDENVICTIKFNMNLLPLHVCIITIKVDH